MNRKEMKNIVGDEEIKEIRQKCFANLEAQVIRPISEAMEHLNNFAFNNALLPNVPAITISVDTFYTLIEYASGDAKDIYKSKGINAGRIFAKKYIDFLRHEVGVPQSITQLLKGWAFFETGANWGTFDIIYEEEQKKVIVTLKNNFLTRKLEKDKHKFCSFTEGYIEGVLWICLKYYPRWFRKVTKFNPGYIEPISVKEEPEGDICRFIVSLQPEELFEVFDEIYKIENLIEVEDFRRIPIEIRTVLETALKKKLTIKQDERIYVPQLLVPFKTLKDKKKMNLKDIAEVYAWASQDAHFTVAYSKEEIIKNLEIVTDFLRNLELMEITEENRAMFRTMALEARAGGGVKKKKGIFISYSHQDKDFVDRLVGELKTSGISLWVDTVEIKVGDIFIDKISEGIDKMDYVGVVLSPDSVNSPWVQKELEIAMTQEIQGKKIKVLPILYRKCEIPNFLMGKLYADFTEEERYEMALEKIIDRFR